MINNLLVSSFNAVCIKLALLPLSSLLIYSYLKIFFVFSMKPDVAYNRFNSIWKHREEFQEGQQILKTS